jgi:hypothetical protein
MHNGQFYRYWSTYTCHRKKIRQVKKRVRAIINTLPFNLPGCSCCFKSQYDALCRVNNITPREAFTDRKIDYKRDLKVSFGDYEPERNH